MQYALHGILGYEFDATRYLDFNIETYYKYFNQLIDINRSKLLNQDPDYVMEVGHAYGFDVLAKYDHKHGIYGRFTRWVMLPATMATRFTRPITTAAIT